MIFFFWGGRFLSWVTVAAKISETWTVCVDITQVSSHCSPTKLTFMGRKDLAPVILFMEGSQYSHLARRPVLLTSLVFGTL